MGLADIFVSALESEETRKAIGNQGIRIFKSSFEEKKEEEGGIISWIWNGAKRLVGFLISVIGKVIGFSATAIWALFVSTAQFIWNFNWNMSDTEIDNQIKARWNALGSMLGGTVGNFVGYLTCGVAPGALIFAFNEPLGAHILKNVSEELAEEFLANVTGLVRYTFMSGVQSLLLWSFKNIRKLIKENVGFVQRVFGNKAADIVKAWGKEGSKPWSFAKKLEEKVESIPNEFVRNFVEEFLEEAWDGCVEAGYVVANSIDSWVALEKFKQETMPILGDTRYVEIQPDRTIEKQRIVLTGPEELLRPQIVQTLTDYQIMTDKDIGQFVGNPIDDYLRGRPQSLRLVIHFFSVKQPPWKPEKEGERLISATYAIPDIKTSKLDWAEIKAACGGENGYMWGRYRVVGLLKNGRQMQVLGATADEAEDRMKALLALSNSELIENKKPTISEDRTQDKSGTYIKQPTKIYPAYFTIMNQYKTAGAQGSGVALNDGKYIRKYDRIPLWVTEKPDGYEERIQELLKKPGLEE